MTDYKPKFQLNFYSTKPGSYHNKLFCFGIKKEIEAFSLLYLFAHNFNYFHKIYLLDFSTKHEYELPNEVVKQFNLTPDVIKDYKSGLF